METEKCLFPNCPRPGSYVRGLCPSHYQTASRLVSQKKTTWNEMEAKGIVGSPKVHTPSQKAADYFLGKKP